MKKFDISQLGNKYDGTPAQGSMYQYETISLLGSNENGTSDIDITSEANMVLTQGYGANMMAP